METQNTIQKLIFNILMGQCPRCGERLEFSAGRCAGFSIIPEPTNLQELEKKLTDWLTENKDEIKSVLAQQRDIDSQPRTYSWSDYDPNLEQESSRAKYRVIKFCSQLSAIIPVLDRIHINDEGGVKHYLNNYSKLIWKLLNFYCLFFYYYLAQSLIVIRH